MSISLSHYFICSLLFLIHDIPKLKCEDSNETRYAEDRYEETHGKIVFSSVIFRHGDRTIKGPTYTTDPIPNSIWRGFLRLTKKGKRQAYALGKWYRNRYTDLVGIEYNSSLVVMDSTNTDRALMSGETFLAAFYPPTENEMWAEDGLKWQPIPVHTESQENDHVLGMSSSCAKYDSQFKNWSVCPEMLEFYEKYKDAFEYICTNANYSMDRCNSKDVFTAAHTVWQVYNVLAIEDANGFTLPDWTKKIYPEPSRTISQKYFTTKTYSVEMRRLKGGPLLGQIIDEMQKKRNGTLAKNLHLYSGQETTISVFLGTLGINNGLIPSYTASILIELRKKKSQYYVTILYRNDTTEPPHMLQLPHCAKYCTLDSFVNATQYLMVDDWEAECNEEILSVGSFGIFQIFLYIVIPLVIIFILVRLFSKNFEVKRRPKTAKFYEQI